MMKNNLDNASKMMWNFLDFILISIDKIERYCEAFINRKFNLFVFVVVNDVCFIMSVNAKWFVKIIENDFFEFSMKWRTFFVIQITSIIFNSINQYRVSIEIRILLKNMIDSISIRVKMISFFEFSFTWNIMTSTSLFFEMFTFINNFLSSLQCRRKLFLLKTACKCSYDWTSACVESFKEIFLAKTFRNLSLTKACFKSRVLRFCNDKNVCAYHDTYTRRYFVSFKYLSNSLSVRENVKLIIAASFSSIVVNSRTFIICSKRTIDE